MHANCDRASSIARHTELCLASLACDAATRSRQEFHTLYFIPFRGELEWVFFFFFFFIFIISWEDRPRVLRRLDILSSSIANLPCIRMLLLLRICSKKYAYSYIYSKKYTYSYIYSRISRISDIWANEFLPRDSSRAIWGSRAAWERRKKISSACCSHV